MNGRRWDLQRWVSPVAIMLVAVLAAAVVLLVARDHAQLRAQRLARAATADAVAPTASALRNATNDASSGAAPNSRQVPYAEGTSIGVSRDVATQDIGALGHRRPVRRVAGLGPGMPGIRRRLPARGCDLTVVVLDQVRERLEVLQRLAARHPPLPFLLD